MVHISEISFKNRKNCTYLYDLDHETTTITTGYLKKNSEWLPNPGGAMFSKPMEEISQEELYNSYFFVCPHVQGQRALME